MLLSKTSLPWIEIHIATLLFGVAGLFGKFVALPALWIVFGRVLFAAAALAVVIKIKKRPWRIASRKDLAILFLLGGVLALHWFTFFHAIQISTVAIGLLSFATFPVFVAFMEPYFFKERLQLRDFMIALVTFAGVALVVPDFDISNQMTAGVLWGLASGFTFAVISLINRKYVASYSGSVMAFYQDLFACLCLLPFIAVLHIMPSAQDWMLLAVLGVLCTALAHTLFINSMKTIKAAQASIIVSLEPVYGIIFALILLHEIPDIRVTLGGLIILGAAYYTMRRK
ncbi:MAG TPA: DMT family transporter [Micavibrio sp.]|nr:DMT family transporter [Micavibrio sp.]HIL29089.1 DMT family transporter [Micavibrio sp.]